MTGYYKKIGGGGDTAITIETQSGISIDATTTAPTKGTTTTDEIKYYTKGNVLTAHYLYVQTSAGSAGSGDYIFDLPTGFSVDTDWLAPDASTYQTIIGWGTVSNNANGINSTTRVARAVLINSTQFKIVYLSSTNSSEIVSDLEIPLSGTNARYSIRLEVPITG